MWIDLERRGFLEPEAETLKAELTLRERLRRQRRPGVPPGGRLGQPSRQGTQLKLAEALASARRYDEALGLALDLVETDRKVTGEPARKLMLAVFQLLPPDSDLAIDYRRRLSFAL